ncbi:hypothetical protein BDD12DRAFT_344774 [Trichophaea hybrida]|nr:hypothetical protein BDD12DRAFT_344774 [Trichophaea hybrida]
MNQKSWRDQKVFQEVLDKLYLENCELKHLEINGQHQSWTGQWLLNVSKSKIGGMGSLDPRYCGLWNPGSWEDISMNISSTSRKKESYGIRYIYSHFKEQSNQKTGDVLACLLKQLAMRSTTVFKHVQVMLDRERERPTIEELYAALEISLAAFVRTYLVFDALDECDRESNEHHSCHYSRG